MESIEQRLARLERSGRRWRGAAVAMGVCLLAIVGKGAGQKPAASETVITHDLQVIDAKGNTVFRAGTSERGEPYFTLTTPDGKDAISAWTAKGIVKLTLRNVGENEYPDVQLFTNKGASRIRFGKDNRASYLSAGTFPGTGGGMFFVNENGEAELRLPKDLKE